MKTAILPDRARTVLKEMLTAEREERWDDADIVCSGRTAWVGTRRIQVKTIFALLRLCLISRTPDSGDEFQRYVLNEEGRMMVTEDHYEPLILRHLRSNVPHNRPAEAAGRSEPTA